MPRNRIARLCRCYCLESCPTCDTMDCSLPGSSVHGISQARILEWIAISFSRGSSQPRNRTHLSCIVRQVLYHWATREALLSNYSYFLRVLFLVGGSDGKVSAYNAGDPGSMPGSGRPPGEGNGNPLQYPYLENSMDGGAWWATVHGVTKSRTRLSDFTLRVQFSGLNAVTYLCHQHHHPSPELFNLPKLKPHAC